MSSSKPITTNAKQQMLIKSTTRYKTKKFFNKSFTNLKSFTPSSYDKQPKTPILPGNTIDLEVQEMVAANPVEVVMKKDGNISEAVGRKKDGVAALKEEWRLDGADVLAQKMMDLEMMDLNDMDHVVDVEEVLHYYSRLTCPTYVEIVDQFFMDMYSEFHVTYPLGSLNGSMRKLASESAYASMRRSLAPLNL